MIVRGTYRMARGWLNHPAFVAQPFDRRSAWCWMIEEAGYAPRRRSIGGKTFELQRGQFTASTRFMAKAWQWSEAAVRRYLSRLRTDAMIDARSDAGQLVITISNYDKYQSPVREADAADDAADDAGATQERRSSDANENEINEINEGNLFPSERERGKKPERPKAQRRKPEVPFPTATEFETRCLEHAATDHPDRDAPHEFKRFAIHAEQNDRRCRDWFAAWRLWLLRKPDHGKTSRSPGSANDAAGSGFSRAGAAAAAANKRVAPS